MHILLRFINLIFYCCSLCKITEGTNIGLISDDDPDIAHAFAYQTTLNSLEPLLAQVPFDNSMETLLAVCDMLNEGVVAIFGSSSTENSNVIQAVCDTIDVPHIETKFNDKLQRSNTMVNLHPHPKTLGQAYVDLVQACGWTQFTVFYEDVEGLSRIGPLLELNQGDFEYNVVARQLDPYWTGSFRTSLKEAWRSGHTDFVLDCNIQNLEKALRHAQQVGLMTDIHRYIITNLDLHTVDLTPYKYSGTEIKGLQLVNPYSKEVINFAVQLQEMENKSDDDIDDEYEPVFYNNSIPTLRLQTALMADAVSLFASAYRESNLTSKSMSCSSTDTWSHGLSLIGDMRMRTIPGITGSITLDHEGFRSEFSLNVTELRKEGIVKIGSWSVSKGVYFDQVPSMNENVDEESLRNKTLIVIIALTDPYAMLKEAEITQVGNDRYEGFGIDLIHELSELEGFKYIFTVREDKANGSYNKTTGTWSGMIGNLLNGDADLAITDLTITAEREEAVDFTSPFMTLGISILSRKPSKAPPNFFSFADPFALEVWVWIGGAYFVVSISLYIMGRLSPSEWTNPFPCIEEPLFLLNQFSLRNSFWFTIGSFMQQGTEIAPIAYSTRMVAGLWYFFTLIMVSSYTANLAAFLALENPDILFNDVHELVARAEKAGIKYGAKKNGATANFFRDSDAENYRKIYQYMELYEDVMVGDNKDGVTRAENEKYAFFMESTSIEYETQRRCNLNQVGGLLDEKGYGIAMRKNTPYRHRLNTALLKLQSSGRVQALKRKWWEEKRGGGQCSGEPESQDADPLTLENLGGVFWVTIGGISAAFVLVFVEMALHELKVSAKEKTSCVKNIKEELKFYIKFQGLVKSVKHRKSASKSPALSEKSKPETSPVNGILPDVPRENAS